MTQLPNIFFGDPSFKRVNEITSPEKLSADELTVLQNMRLDEPAGIASTRKGFSRYGATPVQVDTTGNINSLFDVEDASGNNFLLAAISPTTTGTAGKLRKSVNGTGTYIDLKTGLTNNAKFRMAKFGDNFFFTNNNEKPFFTNLSYIYNLEIVRPDTTSVTAVNNSSGSTAIDVDYFIYYISTDGSRSNCSIPFNVLVLSATSTINVTLNNLPVSPDSRVTSKMIFRSKHNDFSNFYLLDTIDNSITSYQDIKKDDSLDTTTVLTWISAISTSKFIVTNSERLFLGNIAKLMTNRIITPAIFIGGGSSITDDTQTGNLSAGVYKWARSLVDINGNESELVFFTTDTLVAGKKVIFYPPNDAYVTASDPDDASTWLMNSSIKYERIYRTKAGGSQYYFLVDINIIDVRNTYTDNTPDASLIITYPKESVHNSTELVTLATSIVWSEIDQPNELQELNLVQIYPDDEDEITGIFDDDNGLIVFKQKSICKLYTNGDPESWQVVKLVTNKGCDQPDSIYKYGSSYFFMFENKMYIFNGTSAEEEISYLRKPTFDSITTVLASTFWNDSLWYVLAVKISTNYFLLCYDTKLKAWYKFSISKADTIIKKEYGSDAGKLLIGGNLYVTFYDKTKTVDSDTGTNVDITVSLKTKDYAFPDNFIRARLMFLYIDYYRLHSTSTNDITFTLIDSITGNYGSLSDVDDTQDQNIYRIVTDEMAGTLKRCNRLNFSIQGEAISNFIGGKLEYNVETWGNRKKHKKDKKDIITDDGDEFVTDNAGQTVTT